MRVKHTLFHDFIIFFFTFFFFFFELFHIFNGIHEYTYKPKNLGASNIPYSINEFPPSLSASFYKKLVQQAKSTFEIDLL